MARPPIPFKAPRRKPRTSKLLEDRSYIDVEAREVQPKPRLSDKTMRADKKTVPTSRSRKGTAIAAGLASTALGVAALSGKDDKEGTAVRQPVSPPSVGASSRTESKKEIKTKEEKAPAKKGLSDFQKKFKEMRAAGKEIFTWNGKKYTTRYKEETDAQHKTNVAKIKAKNEAANEKKMSEVSKMSKGGYNRKK